MVQSGLPVSPSPFLKQGQHVLLERGPLAGLEGIIREIKGKLRVVVSVTVLQRSVSAEIDGAWLAPLKESHSYTRLTHGAWVRRGK
jgi:transcription antitermination factor NusG